MIPPAGLHTDRADRADDDVPAVALGSFRRLPAWLADAMDAARVRTALARAVPQLADGSHHLLECTPERLRAKEGQWWARYRLRVEEPHGDQRRVVLTGELFPPGAGPLPDAGTPSPLGDPDWAVDLPELGLGLRTQAADPALPALPVLTDPEAARALLEREMAAGPRPGVRVAACRPEVVRYKPGSRCTVLYHLSYAPGAPADWPALVVGKTHQGDKGANAFAAMQALWETDLSSGEVVTLAEPLAFDPELRVLVQGPVPEQVNLKDLLREALREGTEEALVPVREALARTADGLVALHASGVRHGRVHTWEDELAEVREVVARLSLTVPQLASAAEPLLGRLVDLAGRSPADPPGPSHHDFRPAQVLLDGTGAQLRVGFIDFDGFCTAEPALDLGRFRAKLRDIGAADKNGAAALAGPALAARLRLLDELCEEFLERYAQGAPASRARVQLWETLDLLTALLHSWTKVRVARVAPRYALLEHHLQGLLQGTG